MEISSSNYISFKINSHSLRVNKNALLATTIACVAASAFLILRTTLCASFTMAFPALCVLGGVTAASAFYLGLKSYSCGDGNEIPSYQKLIKNSQKAILEHQKKEKDAYVPLEEAIKTAPLLKKPAFKFSHYIAEGQGKRPKMEDVALYKKIENGTLIGVFDGHGGIEVARYAARKFPSIFSKNLCKGHDPYEAYNLTFRELQKNIIVNKKWNCIGSTAAISFIDKKNRVFTATLGDSEINIYRKINGEWKSIPLSCVRDWTHLKDAKRAAKALSNPEIVDKWTNSKVKPRFPSSFFGVNVSRSLGDAKFSVWPISNEEVQHPAVIQKPKITLNYLKKGDILMAACDGLKDFVPENDINSKIQEHENSIEHLAENLIDYALKDKNSLDNVTVLILTAEQESRKVASF